MLQTSLTPFKTLAESLAALDHRMLAQISLSLGAVPNYVMPLPSFRSGSLVAYFAANRVNTPSATVTLSLLHGQLRTECTCGHWGPRDCPNTIAFLLDLAANPPYRDALLTGSLTATKLDEALAQRDRILHDARVQGAVDQWFPSQSAAASREPARQLEWGLEAPVHRWDGAWLALRMRFRGERAQLLPRNLEQVALRPEDARVVGLCETQQATGKKVVFRAAQSSWLLEALRECTGPVFTADFKHELRFLSQPLTLRFDLLEVPDSTLHPSRHLNRTPPHVDRMVPVLGAQWHLGDGLPPVPVAHTLLVPGATSWVWLLERRELRPVAQGIDRYTATRVWERPYLADDAHMRHALYPALRERTRGMPVALPPAEAMGHPALQRPFLTLRIDGSPLDVRAILSAQYPDSTLTLDPASIAAAGADVRRDVGTEDAALARIAEAGFLWSDEDQAFRAQDEAAVALWREGVEALRRATEPRLEVLVAETLRGVKVTERAHPRLRVKMVDNWFDVQLSVSEGEAKNDIARMREALRLKRKWVALDDGTLAQLDGTLRELLEEWDELGVKGDRARLAVHQAGRIDRWLDTAGATVQVDEAAEAFRAKLRAATVKPEPALPEGLRAELRPYQRAGLAWLQFLAEVGAGGVLADDMGLGKTVTTLALLAWLKETQGPAPSLVVCPTSVLAGWQSESARFTPGLRVAVLHGADRHALIAQAKSYDLLVTSYALARRDAEKLAGLSLRALVLDEAQNIKNAAAQTSRAVRTIPAKHRLALTGTPVENRLGELWSLMDFCNEGMLGTARLFENRVERRILEDARGPVTARLRALLRPFVLRRTKAEVLTDLPPKQEIDRPCILGPAQRRAYDVLAHAVRAEVERAVAERGMAGGGLSIFTALLRLRQMACDPRLVDATLPPASSTKRESFLELVRQLADEGRRALVFSQFVELLSLWRQDLDREGIRYEYLDGSTRDRQGAVDRFQHGSATLFLISLKAGGTGLNLTAADTVIHCDPWWNPAVENQATDRAHRIGQTRSVTVYRLLAMGTVEDRIQQLKARKRDLADAVVQEDAGALRGLNEEDLRALLSAVETGWEEEESPAEEPVFGEDNRVVVMPPSIELPSKKRRTRSTK